MASAKKSLSTDGVCPITPTVPTAPTSIYRDSLPMRRPSNDHPLRGVAVALGRARVAKTSLEL
jgi:hypothetical protein